MVIVAVRIIILNLNARFQFGVFKFAKKPCRDSVVQLQVSIILSPIWISMNLGTGAQLSCARFAANFVAISDLFSFYVEQQKWFGFLFCSFFVDSCPYRAHYPLPCAANSNCVRFIFERLTSIRSKTSFFFFKCLNLISSKLEPPRVQTTFKAKCKHCNKTLYKRRFDSHSVCFFFARKTEHFNSILLNVSLAGIKFLHNKQIILFRASRELNCP